MLLPLRKAGMDSVCYKRHQWPGSEADANPESGDE